MYEEIKNKLKDFPKFRERRFRVEYLTILSLRKLGFEKKVKNGSTLSLEELAEFAPTYVSYERIWRWVLRDFPDLRGKDYDTKEEVEQEKMLKMGYEPGYYQDMKKLSLI